MHLPFLLQRAPPTPHPSATSPAGSQQNRWGAPSSPRGRTPVSQGAPTPPGVLRPPTPCSVDSRSRASLQGWARRVGGSSPCSVPLRPACGPRWGKGWAPDSLRLCSLPFWVVFSASSPPVGGLLCCVQVVFRVSYIRSSSFLDVCGGGCRLPSNPTVFSPPSPDLILNP